MEIYQTMPMELIKDPGHIRIEDYDYHLPEKRIAQYPLEIRDRSKVLICKEGLISEGVFHKIAASLPPESLLVLNETKVIHARLLFQKDGGSIIEIFCLEPMAPFRDHQQAFQQREQADWLCMVGNSKRWKSGKLTLCISQQGTAIKLYAERINKMPGGTSQVRFTWNPPAISFAEVLDQAGKIPLPPYIHRQAIKKDEITYQTVYASHDGSVAAPTAGLHFSDTVMKSIKDRRIDILKFILHVGAGTFKPVSSELLSAHEMHAEQVYLPLSSLEMLRASLEKPIVAVGTTTTRLLESLYWHGVKVIRGKIKADEMEVGQWEPYEQGNLPEINRKDALEAVIEGMNNIGSAVLYGKTSLLIAPGYRFRYPDILITNFHQPKSTLLLLIAAFIGDDWKKAYQFAMEHDFRFLSYGDSCLFYRNGYAQE